MSEVEAPPRAVPTASPADAAAVRHADGPEPVIRTRRLTKKYGTLTAVDKLDLEVYPGEIFGLLGQNGAGKTTTILMLLGLSEPTSGEASVMGLDPAWEPREVKRRVGYLPDAVGFYGGLSGRENLRYTAQLNGLGRRETETAIDAVLVNVGLTDRANDPVETYSRGMRQRLGIADALVKSPDLLILDEPTTSIDPLGVVEILDLLRKLVDERGLAIMLSSHLLTQVQSVCDRIGIFASGRLVGQGTVAELAAQFGDGTAVIEVELELPTPADVERAATVLRALPLVESVEAPGSGSRAWRIHVRPADCRGPRAPGGPGRRRGSRPAADGPAPRGAIARRHLSGGARTAGAAGEDRCQAPIVRQETSMTATVVPAQEPVPTQPPERPVLRVPHAGWRVIAAKEFSDHLLSVRFLVLLIMLGLAAAIPLYFAADQIKAAAPQVAGAQAVFLFLFTVGSPDISILRVDVFVGLVAPLLGLAFAFDAVNGERSEGTLPRLLAQPIYRDDVINGKFAAGMAVIGLVLVAVVALIAAFGIIRLGIVPHDQDIVRLIAWLAATFLYVALWLAFGLLLSVVIRRAATAAVVGFGVWLLIAVFGGLFTTIINGVFAPSADATLDQQIGSIQIQQFIGRLLPSTLYSDISTVILDPRTVRISAPASVGEAQQGAQQIQGVVLSIDQSLLLVWPQIVALVALTVVCFGLAYVAFMRQEVRA